MTRFTYAANTNRVSPVPESGYSEWRKSRSRVRVRHGERQRQRVGEK